MDSINLKHRKMWQKSEKDRYKEEGKQEKSRKDKDSEMKQNNKLKMKINCTICVNDFHCQQTDSLRKQSYT